MKGASFEQKPFKTFSNIGLEVDLTPWVGILRPMTPRHITNYQGHFRSWKVTSSFSGITFDRDQLERWKHHICVQVDHANRLICNMTFSGQVMTLTWGHDLDLRSNFQHDLLRSNYISFDAALQEKHDAGKMNVMPLLSQKLLPKNVFRKRFFIVFALWRLNC